MGKQIVTTDKYILEVGDAEIEYNDYWVYIDPKNGLDYGDNGNPIVKNKLPKSWFEKLHDRANYKTVLAHTPLNGSPLLDDVKLI